MVRWWFTPRTRRTPREAVASTSIDWAGGGADADDLRFLLRYGALAASDGAPWSLRLDRDAIEVSLEHRCPYEANHHAHRELVTSCGAAIAQLRLSIRQLGWVESLVLFPDEARPSLLARVYLEERGRATPEAYVLYQALRAPTFAGDAPAAIDAALLDEIRDVCAQERATLHWVDRGLLTVANPDGEPSCGAPIGDALAGLHALQLQTFRPDTSEWLDRRQTALAPMAAAVIATRGDALRDWIAAGQALSRALLRARVDGVLATVEAIASPSLRARVAAGAFGAHVRGTPQLIVRFGYPSVLRLPARPEARRLEAAPADPSAE